MRLFQILKETHETAEEFLTSTYWTPVYVFGKNGLKMSLQEAKEYVHSLKQENKPVQPYRYMVPNKPNPCKCNIVISITESEICKPIERRIWQCSICGRILHDLKT